MENCRMQAFTRFYSTVNISCRQTNVIYKRSQDSILLWICRVDEQGSYTGCHKILFYYEYVLRMDNCHIQAFTRFYSSVNMSYGWKNVIYRLSQEYILLKIDLADGKCHMQAFTRFYSTVNITCGHTNICKYILRINKGHMQAVIRFYSIVNMTCGRKIVICRLSQDSILL